MLYQEASDGALTSRTLNNKFGKGHAMYRKVALAAVVEVAYGVFTRTWLSRHFQGVELELLITALRIVTAALYWYLFRNLIGARTSSPSSLRTPLVLAGIVSVLAIPVLFRGWSPGGGIGTAIIFALTSFVVGFREELLYRAVLINLLQPKYGVLTALIISTILFTVYHYGTWAVSWLIVSEIVVMSLILGLIYIYSGSLIAVTLLHATYDAIWFFGPFLPSPIPDIWRPAFLLAGVVCVCLWVIRVRWIAPVIHAESSSA